MKTIEIIISLAGEAHLETKGFNGNQCREASRFIESALGKSVDEKLTAEFHESTAQQQGQLNQDLPSS